MGWPRGHGRDGAAMHIWTDEEPNLGPPREGTVGFDCGGPHKRQVPSVTCAARPRDSSIAFRTTANARGLGCASPSFVGIRPFTA